jgi:Ca2+ transporting ATPase
VPGDVVSVTIGDRIPADCRILSIQSNSFNIDQSILTGESESVSKGTHAIEDASAVKQDQINMLFSGTTVVTGHATALVVLTGGNTAIGDIHESITAQISQPTPLKEKLNDFGDMLAKVISAICVLVWLINYRNFSDPSHGSFAKGATLRSPFRLVSLPSLKAWLSSLPPVWLSVRARWRRETPSSAVCHLLRRSEAAASSALTRLVL